MSTFATDIAEWAWALKFSDIPERVIRKAKLQLYSVLAAMHASHRHEIGQEVVDAVSAWAGDGPSTILPAGKKVDVLSAAYANASLSAALDYDDYLLFGHTGHSAVCASLAMAEREGSSIEEMLTAQVIANEIEGRLGATVVLGPHNGQGWSHIHLAGSAAAAAKLMGLSAEQTAHAIGISLYQPTYVLWPGFMGPDSKATTAATPTVTGIQAAILAGKGATGPLDVIEHPQGYMARLSYAPSPHFLSGLGKAWTTDTLGYKVYPGCAYIDTTVDALLEIMRLYSDETGKALSPDDVDEIKVEATLLTVEMDHLSKTGGSFDPVNPVSINFSIPGNLAIVLLTGELNADNLSKKWLSEYGEQIEKFSRKVKLVHDFDMTMDFLSSMDEVLDIRKLLKQMKIQDLVRFRMKAKEQYGSSMGVTVPEVLDAVMGSPKMRSRAWKGITDSARGLFQQTGPAVSSGYDLGDRPLENFTMPFSSRVTVTTRSGFSTVYQQDIPIGGPGYPFDKTIDSVLDKYRREADSNLDKGKVHEFIENEENLESKLTVEALAGLCSIS